MSYPHGLFSWTDISLPDPAGGSKFYADLFGWQAEDQHDPEGHYVYTMFSKDGKSVAGLGPQAPGAADQGIPPMWTSYATVDDIDDALAKWTEAGGSVLMPAMEVFDAGKMAIVADPQGAVMSLWDAGVHLGAGVFNTHGAMTWNELATRDTAAAREFLGAVLGFEFEQFEGAGAGEYWLITLGAKAEGEPYAADKYNGGILAMDEDWPAELPSHWMVYFRVDDTDEVVARLESLGGNVSVPPFDAPVGRIAVVNDPQGGTFSLIAPPSETG